VSLLQAHLYRHKRQRETEVIDEGDDEDDYEEFLPGGLKVMMLSSSASNCISRLARLMLPLCSRETRHSTHQRTHTPAFNVSSYTERERKINAFILSAVMRETVCLY
jgi:hypothetical protein